MYPQPSVYPQYGPTAAAAPTISPPLSPESNHSSNNHEKLSPCPDQLQLSSPQPINGKEAVSPGQSEKETQSATPFLKQRAHTMQTGTCTQSPHKDEHQSREQQQLFSRNSQAQQPEGSPPHQRHHIRRPSVAIKFCPTYKHAWSYGEPPVSPVAECVLKGEFPWHG